MATPRKHWFKVADALCREPLSNDALACAMRLMGWMNSRRARDERDAEDACKVVLRPADLMGIAGKGTLRSARAVLFGLAASGLEASRPRADIGATSARYPGDIGSISVRARGDLTEITWPNLAEFQGWTSESREKVSRELPSPTPTPTPTPGEEKRREEREDAPRTEPDPPEIGAAGEEAARAKLDRDARKALSMLSGQEGSAEEKLRFLRAELRSAEAEVSDRRAAGRHSGLQRVLLGFYGSYLRGPRRHKTEIEREERHARYRRLIEESDRAKFGRTLSDDEMPDFARDA